MADSLQETIFVRGYAFVWLTSYIRRLAFPASSAALLKSRPSETILNPQHPSPFPIPLGFARGPRPSDPDASSGQSSFQQLTSKPALLHPASLRTSPTPLLENFFLSLNKVIPVGVTKEYRPLAMPLTMTWCRAPAGSTRYFVGILDHCHSKAFSVNFKT
jgi:hypothetical protein